MPDHRPDTPASPQQALLAFRIIGAILGLGVTLFAGVSWYVNRGALVPPGEVGSLMFNLMLAMAAGAAIAAIPFWRARVTPLLERVPPAGDWPPHTALVQTNVIVVWAIIEGAALFAEIV